MGITGQGGVLGIPPTALSHLKTTLILFVISAVLLGCQSSLQTYIAERTFVELNYGVEELHVTLAVENPVDFDDSAMSDLVWVQRRIAETILPDDDGLKHATIFLPATEESWQSARDCVSNMSEVPSMAFTTSSDEIVVVFNPEVWRERALEDIVETYIHELIHHVAKVIDGDMDADHTNPAYWGKGGLVSIIFKEWQEQRELPRQLCRQ